MTKLTIRELLDDAGMYNPTHADILAERVEVVLGLHIEDGTGFCLACEHSFPCPTVRALDGEQP